MVLGKSKLSNCFFCFNLLALASICLAIASKQLGKTLKTNIFRQNPILYYNIRTHARLS